MEIQQSSTQNRNESTKIGSLPSWSLRVFDVAFVGFLVLLAVKYYFAISTYQIPMWDAAAYLTNARDWLRNEPLYAIYRPPLISWLIAAVWTVTGEKWEAVKYFSALFGIGAAAIAYVAFRRFKGPLFALGVVVLTMLSPEVFFYSTQIYTESMSLFFVLATLYFVKSEKPSYWFLAGISIGLTFASRYPVVLQAGVLAVVESFARKNWGILSRALLGAVPVIGAVVLLVFLKTGTFQTTVASNTNFSVLLSPYYMLNSTFTWGWIFLLVPLALILRGTYSERFNLVFVAWFVCSVVFWSANATHDLRFTIQFTPAVNFLALLAIETFVKNGEPLGTFLSKNLVFFPKKSALQTL